MPPEVDQGRALYSQGKYADAIPLLARAAASAPNKHEIWQDLVLAASRSGRQSEAVGFCKQALKYHPDSDWLWRQLGHLLITLGLLDEAEDVLDAAWKLNPKAPFLWRYLADLHKARNHVEEEISALEHLMEQNLASADDIIRLGNIYFNFKCDYGRAIQIYQHATVIGPTAVAFYNLGLAFNNSEISQDLDAADAYRRALIVEPDYALALAKLAETATKLKPLANRARAEISGLLASAHRPQFYINPIELLGLDYTIEDDPEATRKIQKAAKRLLHEIELNDGAVGWMPGLTIDKAHALALIDELHDSVRLGYHALILRNPDLHRFLTCGEIEHFLYADERIPEEALNTIEDDSSQFLAFISKPFSQQYDFVLTSAIDQNKMAVMEVLFDGRRWVVPEDTDACFRGAMQRVRALLDQAEQRLASERKPALQELQTWLEHSRIVDTFNLLPTAYFREEQIRLVAIIRGMAIECYNRHDDAELSRSILNLCKRFRFKSAELNKQLAEDFAAVERIISEERAAAERIRREERENAFVADLRRGVPVRITSEGISVNGVGLRPEEVETIRWGEYVRTVNGIESNHEFCVVATGKDRRVAIEWGKRSIFRAVGDMFRKRGDTWPIEELGAEGQQQMFRKAVNAALHFIVPALMSKVVDLLQTGRSMPIGQCLLSRKGITVETGFLRSKPRLIPWRYAAVAFQSGQVVVTDRRDRKATTAMSIMQTDNAVLLPLLVEFLKDAKEDGETVPESADVVMPVPKSAARWAVAWFVVIGILGAIVVAVWAANSGSSSPSKPQPSRTTAPRQPIYITPSPTRPTAQPNTPTYRPPSVTTSSWDQERQAIDLAKAKVARMETELESLGREIDRERLTLNQYSESAVTRFNQKVNRYNALLDELDEQIRIVNRMVDDYNRKARR